MIPGEYKYSDPNALLSANCGLATATIQVTHTGIDPYRWAATSTFMRSMRLWSLIVKPAVATA